MTCCSRGKGAATVRPAIELYFASSIRQWQVSAADDLFLSINVVGNGFFSPKVSDLCQNFTSSSVMKCRRFCQTPDRRSRDSTSSNS